MLKSFCVDLQHGLQTCGGGFELIRPRFWAGKDNIFHLVTRPPPIFGNFAGKTVTRLGLARSIAQGLCFLTSLIFGGKIAFRPKSTFLSAAVKQLNASAEESASPESQMLKERLKLLLLLLSFWLRSPQETSTTTAAHSFTKKQNVFEQQNYRRHNLDNFM